MVDRRLLVSFSGGETSAYMTQWILREWRDKFDEIKVVFANTGQENEATLEFVRNCDESFGFNTIWVESLVHYDMVKAPTANVTCFETASRRGEPFEDVIRKYGIPNSKFPHCTRTLKQNPIHNYLRSIGWKINTYDTAIGIRSDEIDRMSVEARKHRYVYPLISHNPMTKPEINLWWSRQPFRLELRGYQGNCKWCWKKTFRKHLTILDETPEAYDFPERMEHEYGFVGPEFAKGTAEGYRRVFFRKNLSVAGLKEEFRKVKSSGGFEPFEDDSVVLNEELDFPEGGCVEHCEPFGDDGVEDLL